MDIADLQEYSIKGESINIDQAVLLLKKRIEQLESPRFRHWVWQEQTKADVTSIFGPISENVAKVINLNFHVDGCGNTRDLELIVKVKAKSLLQSFIKTLLRPKQENVDLDNEN